MIQRAKLIERSHPLEEAANRKLFERRNQAKGDDWREHSDLYLKERIVEEVEELFNLIDDRRALRSRLSEEEYRRALLDEGGDIRNFVLFVLDKHGALDG